MHSLLFADNAKSAVPRTAARQKSRCKLKRGIQTVIRVDVFDLVREGYVSARVKNLFTALCGNAVTRTALAQLVSANIIFVVNVGGKTEHL